MIGGHSLGGVIASRYAASQKNGLKGVFSASYPDEKGSLAETNLPVLSLTASNDEVLNQGNYQAAKPICRIQLFSKQSQEAITLVLVVTAHSVVTELPRFQMRNNNNRSLRNSHNG